MAVLWGLRFSRTILFLQTFILSVEFDHDRLISLATECVDSVDDVVESGVSGVLRQKPSHTHIKFENIVDAFATAVPGTKLILCEGFVVLNLEQQLLGALFSVCTDNMAVSQALVY